MSDEKKSKLRDLLPFLFMGSLFVVVQGLALMVAVPFEEAGAQAFADPNDPLDLVYFFASLLVLTALMLLISKFWKKQLIQIIVLGATALLMFYVFGILLSFVFPDLITLALSIAAVALVVALLVKYPEWYVIDATGILTGVGAIAMLGISLSILLTIVLLIALAIYDAISVFQTKHMIDLADTVWDLKLPMYLLIPKTRRYSLLKVTKGLKQKLKEGEEREAFFMGLGDIVMPGILAVAAFSNLSSNGLLVGLSVILGTLLGYVVLTAILITRGALPGLPFLCTGAILGYLISSYVLFGGIAGITFSI